MLGPINIFWTIWIHSGPVWDGTAMKLIVNLALLSSNPLGHLFHGGDQEYKGLSQDFTALWPPLLDKNNQVQESHSDNPNKNYLAENRKNSLNKPFFWQDF